MTFTLLSPVALFLFATIACFEIYRGIKRGFVLSLVNLGNTAVSLLLSFAVTPLISELLSGFILTFLRRLDVYQSIVRTLTSLNSFVSAFMEMLISSVLFLIVFFVLRFISFRLLLRIYKSRTRLKRDDPGYGREDHSCADRLSKTRGAVCGGISAFFITMILFSPVMGTLELASNALSITESVSTQAINAIGKGNMRMVNEFSDDIGGNVFYRLGGRWIYRNAASARLGEKRICLLSEIEVIERMSDDMLKLYAILQKPQTATAEHVEAVSRLREDLKELESCDQLLGEAVRQCASSWKNGGSFFLLKRPALHPMVDPLFTDLLNACSKTVSYTAKRDVDTILEIYGILLESGIFNTNSADYNQILSLLFQHRTMEKIDGALAKNPSMQDVSAGSVLLTTLGSCIDMLGLTDQQYAALVQSIAASLNTINATEMSEEEKMQSFAFFTQQAFSDIGMQVSFDVAQIFSAELLREFPGTDVSAANVKFILEKYKNG